MISKEWRTIFIHVPKCGGTSIEKALGYHDSFDARGKQDHRAVRVLERPVPITDLLSSTENITLGVRRVLNPILKNENPRNRETVSAEEFKSFFKFTIVRNPWARAVSWYRNVCADPEHLKQLKISGDIRFEEFLRRFAGSGGLRTQLYWLKDFKGRIGVDYIGRFEKLAEEFSYIKKELGLPEEVTLPHELRSKGFDYRDYYDDASRRFVAEYYRDEIELFDYQF
ncbi:Sulfotransferase domain containing protein [Salinisphaera shabanensis E1L3A]|uniref:Sulfotransferase domain containing protein n=1 Tax=Salinisphaera shabanensis E1L3A TaxID=1033802 RepID=U2FT08_9GAMM|nr:sulfotransferase family 2 domain-containing protein [Salinisphaera shabanensis]ERJ17538.1 Sulfotransferase domain containing protein [Salinisphaera shabanensis E1L3A]